MTAPAVAARGNRVKPRPARVVGLDTRGGRAIAPPARIEMVDSDYEELLMSGRAKFWWVVAVIFTFVNLFGAVYAAIMREMIHMCIHLAMLVLVAVIVWARAPKRVATY